MFDFRNKMQQFPLLMNLIFENIYCNTDVRMEVNNATKRYEPKGQSVEVGLIKFLIDNGEDVLNTFIERNKNLKCVTQLPFD